MTLHHGVRRSDGCWGAASSGPKAYFFPFSCSHRFDMGAHFCSSTHFQTIAKFDNVLCFVALVVRTSLHPRSSPARDTFVSCFTSGLLSSWRLRKHLIISIDFWHCNVSTSSSAALGRAQSRAGVGQEQEDQERSWRIKTELFTEKPLDWTRCTRVGSYLFLHRHTDYINYFSDVTKLSVSTGMTDSFLPVQ